MRLSPRGIAHIKEFEGLRLTAYQDGGGVWTIGYGHTGRDVRPGLKISLETAERLLVRDVAAFESDVGSLVKVPINQDQFDALVSFAFNCGSDIDADTVAEGLGDSTLLRKLNAGDYDGAALEFRKWVNDNGRRIEGLVRRRHAEERMFRGLA